MQGVTASKDNLVIYRRRAVILTHAAVIHREAVKKEAAAAKVVEAAAKKAAKAAKNTPAVPVAPAPAAVDRYAQYADIVNADLIDDENLVYGPVSVVLPVDEGNIYDMS